ncbi:hypothetical protein N7G274_002977 [Stereocaulon virgatum]|uniref:Uncharacterized protein n=1 Tax=Stereocaulon virgatum TaxID=373712 RepID=A0ABR4AEM5_9LECA
MILVKPTISLQARIQRTACELLALPFHYILNITLSYPSNAPPKTLTLPPQPSLLAAAIAPTPPNPTQTVSLNVSRIPFNLDSIATGPTILTYANKTAYIGQVNPASTPKNLVFSTV